jgi:hypothetical protein
MSSNVERHQHLERTQIELKDQHGRLWYTESQVGLDGKRRPRIVPVGTFVPSFTAPFDFIPPQKFLRFDPRRPSEITINYDGWASEIRAAHADLRQEMVKLATRLYKGEAAKYIESPTDEMRDMIFGGGKGPEPVEPIIAAKQGNGWILGLRAFDATKRGDELLKPFLDRWVEVRFRDVRMDDNGEVETINFAEGEEDLSDEELEALTAPGK